MTAVESGWAQVTIVIVVWIVTLAVAWTKFGGRIDLLDLRMKNMEETNKLIAETLKEFNKNDKALALLQTEHASLAKSHATLHETVELMRKGEGFITGPRRGNIEGEWPSRVG